MKYKIFLLSFVMIFLITIISAQGTIENLEFSQELPDFVAGETITTSFSFDYPSKNIMEGLLVVVINISSNDSNYPVWKNDFEMNGTMVVTKDLFIEKEYELECHTEDFIMTYPFGQTEIKDIPEGSFFCTNEELLAMNLGSNNEVTLNIKSNPALWPGNYNFSVELFYPEENAQFELAVLSPTDLIYGTRRIPFEIMTLKDVALIEYKNWNDKNPRWRRLCRDCNEYGMFRNRFKTFKEGEHNITIRAIDYFGHIKEKDILFSVDSKKPKISRTEPRRNKFTNGSDFYIKFKEENIKNVSLIIKGSEIENYPVDFSKCSEKRGYLECDITANVTKFDGQEVEYWFEVSDFVRSVSSKKTKIKVDTTPPEIENTDSFWEQGEGRYAKYIYFGIEITELNFDKVVYSYEYEKRGKSYERERRLCSRLKNGICEKRIRIRDYYENLKVIVKDDAGNLISYPVNF